MINFYYDILTERGPVPNGASYYEMEKHKFIFPYTEEERNCIKPICDFWITSVRNQIEPVLYTKEQTAPDLFYPIELLNYYSPKSIVDCIPSKSLKRLKRGTMKPLLLAQSFVGLGQMSWIKRHADDLFNAGVDPKNIKIVLSDMGNSYRQFFSPYRTFSFDWWQVESQLIINGAYDKYEKFLKHQDRYIKPSGKRTHLYSIENKKDSLHGAAIVSELLIRGFSDNIKSPTYDIKYDSRDFRLYDRFRHDEKNQGKEEAIKKVFDGITCDIQPAHIKIIVQNYAGGSNDEYLDETFSIFTDFEIWKAIVDQQPFVVMGSHQIMRYLNSQGYFTFQETINEQYDVMQGFPQRAEFIVNSLVRLKDIDIEKEIEKQKPFMKVNRARFLQQSHLSKFVSLYDRIRND